MPESIAKSAASLPEFVQVTAPRWPVTVGVAEVYAAFSATVPVTRRVTVSDSPTSVTVIVTARVAVRGGVWPSEATTLRL